MSSIARKYRRFQSTRHQHGTATAVRATGASLANSAVYRWQVMRRTVLRPLLGDAHGVYAPADNDRYGARSFLPAPEPASAGVTPRSIAVVIPVYRGAEYTRACLESVLASPAPAIGEVVVVDDASPDPDITAYVDELADAGRVRLLRNSENLGFVGSVNRGMRAAGERDVVLLNSDAVVSGDWADRLAAHAARDRTIGTVTPFSNNATICSYPTLLGTHDPFEGETVADVDAAFAVANRGRACGIPTGVGFCMFIRRACLRAVGPFDEEAFEKGYGEENDFCLRATRRGWRHVLATDTFVWHHGEVSFGQEASDLQAVALTRLRRLHPRYLKTVARHVRDDPARPSRVAATAARFRRGGRPVVLMVMHALGTGTEAHLLHLCRHFAADARFLVLQATEAGSARLWCPDASEGLDVRWCVATDAHLLTEVVRSFGVTRVHIHHTLGLPFELRRLLESLAVPFDMTIHDFYSICPRIRLAIPHQSFCGGPDEERCSDCLTLSPRAEVARIDDWRRAHAWLLADAERVIAPSRDAAGHIAPFVEGPELIVAPHDTLDHETFPAPAPQPLLPGEPLRVALLGVLSEDKGASLVGEFLRSLGGSRGSLDMTLIGFVPDEAARLVRGASLRITGIYDPGDLTARLAAARPHVVWFPAQWPETYSYTLSEAMSAGLPVLAPNLGAFSERVENRPWSWLVPWNTSPAAFAAVFAALADQLRRGAWDGLDSLTTCRRPDAAARYPVDARPDFYDSDYLAPALEARRRQGGRP